MLRQCCVNATLSQVEAVMQAQAQSLQAQSCQRMGQCWRQLLLGRSSAESGQVGAVAAQQQRRSGSSRQQQAACECTTLLLKYVGLQVPVC